MIATRAAGCRDEGATEGEIHQKFLLFGLSLRLLLRKIHLPRQREAFPVGKSYAINIEAEKLTFSIGEKPNDGREDIL